MNIILLGAPGCGKGTQARLLSQKYNLKQLSTGDLFRQNMQNKTPIGMKAESYISKGDLVPDEITIQMLKESIEKNTGYIFDGFPRTVSQAKALHDIIKIDRVLFFDVDEEEIKTRLLGRMTCNKCGEIYNKFKQNNKACTKCGGKLISRVDDTEETIKNRIEVFNKSTKPLIEFYNTEKLLSVIDSNGTPDEQFSNVVCELERLKVK